MTIDELERAAELLMGRTIAAFVTRVEDDGREVFVVICDDGTTLTCEHSIVEGPPEIDAASVPRKNQDLKLKELMMAAEEAVENFGDEYPGGVVRLQTALDALEVVKSSLISLHRSGRFKGCPR
jgi:hypothetical protein